MPTFGPFLPAMWQSPHTCAGAHHEGPSLPACFQGDLRDGDSPSLDREETEQLVFMIFYSIALFWAWFSLMISQSDLNSFTLLKSKC